MIRSSVRALAISLSVTVALVTMAFAQERPPTPSESPATPATPSAPAATPSEAPALLPPVTVTAPPLVSSSSEVIVPGRDFELRPQGRPADVLRLVPAS